MTAAIDLGISTGFGLLVGLVAYLVMWLFDLIKRVASAITKLRDAADSHLCAIGARQRGLKAVS